jgi:hypothetical protein
VHLGLLGRNCVLSLLGLSCAGDSKPVSLIELDALHSNQEREGVGIEPAGISFLVLEGVKELLAFLQYPALNDRSVLSGSELALNLLYRHELEGKRSLELACLDTLLAHFVCLYDYVDGQFWLAFDSYDQNVKRLAWNFPFALGVRYSLTNQIKNPTAWQKFKSQILAFLGLS